MIVARGAAPIDVLRRLAGHEAPILPEVLAGSGAAPAVQAVDHGRSDAARIEDEPRNAGGELAALADRRLYCLALGLVAPSIGHSCYPMRDFSRPITLLMLSP